MPSKKKRSPWTAALVERMLESRPHPQQAFRACLGVLALQREYGERLERACERAVKANARTYSSVKTILQHGLDGQPLQLTANLPLPTHENIRGADYYQ